MLNNETHIGSFHIRCINCSDTIKCLDLLRNALLIANVDNLITTNIYNNDCNIYIDIVSNNFGFFTREEIEIIKTNIISITKSIQLDRCSFVEKPTYQYTSLQKNVKVNKGIICRLIDYILSFFY